MPSWLFKNDGTLSFTFLSCVNVTYHNPTRTDLWTIQPKYVYVTYNDKTIRKTEGGRMGARDAQAIRNGLVSKIDIFYE